MVSTVEDLDSLVAFGIRIVPPGLEDREGSKRSSGPNIILTLAGIVHTMLVLIKGNTLFLNSVRRLLLSGLNPPSMLFAYDIINIPLPLKYL